MREPDDQNACMPRLLRQSSSYWMFIRSARYLKKSMQRLENTILKERERSQLIIESWSIAVHKLAGAVVVAVGPASQCLSGTESPCSTAEEPVPISSWLGGQRFLFFIFRLHSTTQILTTHAHLALRAHKRKPYFYEHLRKLSRQILKIDEITTSASLSTRTSPTTESTRPLILENSLPWGVKPKTWSARLL